MTRKYKTVIGIIEDIDHRKALTLTYTQRVLAYKDNYHEYYEIQYEDFCTKAFEQSQQIANVISLSITTQTEELLSKLTPISIGSYQPWQEGKEHPLLSKLKSLFGM